MTAETIKPHQLRKKSKSQEIRQMIDAGCKSVKVLAQMTNTSRGLASRILKQYKIDTNQLDEYKEKRADILAGLQHRILKSVTIEDIKKAPVGSRVLAACQLYDKERLERGQSTANVAQITADIMALKRQKSVTLDASDQMSDIGECK